MRPTQSWGLLEVLCSHPILAAMMLFNEGSHAQERSGVECH